MPSEKPLSEARRRAAEELDRLVTMMARLRAPDGCPWDRAQDLATLRPYLIEEAYEVLDAMEGGGRDHCEELGDLLFQIVFHAEIARERGEWDMSDVVRAIADKIEFRHPHVFAGATAGNADEVAQSWAALKAQEKERKKGARVSVLDGVPPSAPGLLRAERLTEKASRIGFDWERVADVRAKVDEELAELDAAMAGGDRSEIEHELGDVLFALANLARHLATPAEDALRSALRRFERRFVWMEDRLHELGHGVGHPASVEVMDGLWEQAKRRERSGDL
jgi:ATP diphosphatase